MKKSKLLVVVMAAILAIAMFAGCADNGTTPNASSDPNASANNKYFVSQEPLELSIFMHMGVWGAMRDDWVIYGKDGGATDFTNVTLKGTANTSSTDHAQEFSLMMTSDVLPDIIHGNKNELNKAAVEEEALIPLDDLIAKNAPNIKKFLDDNAWARAGSVASDGKLYYIPNSFQGIPSMGFFIRQDWLDKLNLKVPTTVDEYYKVLKAFREEDPNGNGEKDEIPYLYRDAGVDGLIQLWGAYNSWYAFDDGKVFHGKATKEYKTAMKELSKWYEEGLIDPQIFTRGQKARDILLDNNTGGSTHDWFSSTGAFNHLASKIEGFNWVAFAPPADVNGKVKEIFSRQALSGQGWGISADNKHPEETMKYFDFWFTPEGQTLFSYGIEGVDWTMVDGKPEATSTVKDAKDGAPTYLRNRGQNEIGTQMLIDAEVSIMKQQSRDGYKLYDENNYCVKQFPKLSYTAEEEKVITEKETAMNTYINEKQQKWLMGQEDIDAGWDSYLKELDTMGMKDLQKVYQDAYNRYLADLK